MMVIVKCYTSFTKGAPDSFCKLTEPETLRDRAVTQAAYSDTHGWV